MAIVRVRLAAAFVVVSLQDVLRAAGVRVDSFRRPALADVGRVRGR